MSTTESCRNHAGIQAEYVCFVCKAPICPACVCTLGNGAVVCPACAAPEPLATVPLVTKAATEDEYAVAAVQSYAQALPERPGFGPCKNHPDVPAVACCSSCRSLICATCDFPFGPVHLCPACATNPQQGITPKRKSLAFWSIGLGAATFLGSVGLFVLGALLVRGRRDAELVPLMGCIVILFLIVALVGFALGLTSFNRRANNPGYLWIGPILNGIVAAVWLLLIIIGNMQRM